MPTIAAGASLTIQLLAGDTIGLDGTGTVRMSTAMQNVDTSTNTFAVSATRGPYPLTGSLIVTAGPLAPVLYEINTAATNEAQAAVLCSAIGRSGKVWGNGNYVIGTSTITANSVKPGALLRLRGLLAKMPSFNGGHAITISLKQGGNTVVIGQTSLGATVANYPFAQDLQLSYDRKFAHPSGTNTVNLFGEASTVAGTYTLYEAVATDPPVTDACRAQSSIAFASYTAPPTVETVLIDFTADVTLSVAVDIVTGDSVELVFCSLEVLSSPTYGLSTGASPTLFAGDSLTEGSGATAGNELPNLVAKARPGRGVLNFGLGGQLITSIVDRIVADPVAGKYWDLVLWAGINDVQNDAATWFATVKAQISRLQAFRAPSSRMMILNYHPSSGWSAQFKAAGVSVNALLLAEYGDLVVDVYTAVGTSGGVVPAPNLADALHLSNTGYGLVKDAVIAKISALGWA